MSDTADGAQRQLLQSLIVRLEKDELAEYTKASNFHYWMWHLCAGAAFLTSLVSGALASLISDRTFAAYGKVLLAALSFISAGATGLVSLYKFREKEALREEGRIEMQDIVDNAKSLLASCKTDDECGRAYHTVRERARVLSMNQHRRDIALRSDELPKADKV